MNKRIKELETKAWGQVNRTNGLVRTEDFNQKFAELIVRECMGVNSTLLGHNTCKNLHNLYEEHFGVEE